MRIYKNDQQIKRNRRVAQILFFVSLAILVSGLIVTNSVTRNEVLITLVPCVVLPIGLVTTWLSVRMTNQYIREPHPEDVLQLAAKGVGQDSAIYHYLFKANHVLICPQGVFTFTTRFQQGPIKVKGTAIIDYKARGIFGKWLTFMRQEQLGEPFKEADEAAESIQPLIDEALPQAQLEVQPVIVFINPKVQMEVEDSPIPVVFGDPKKKPSLKTLLRESRREGTALTPKQLSLIEERLNSELRIQSTPIESKETKGGSDDD
jgi:hypothetical protein